MYKQAFVVGLVNELPVSEFMGPKIYVQKYINIDTYKIIIIIAIRIEFEWRKLLSLVLWKRLLVFNSIKYMIVNVTTLRTN